MSDLQIYRFPRNWWQKPRNSIADFIKIQTHVRLNFQNVRLNIIFPSASMKCVDEIKHLHLNSFIFHFLFLFIYLFWGGREGEGRKSNMIVANYINARKSTSSHYWWGNLSPLMLIFQNSTVFSQKIIRSLLTRFGL